MVVGSGFSIGEGLMWGVMLALARTISAQLPHLSLLVQGGSVLLLPLLVTFYQLGILVTQAGPCPCGRGQSALFLLLAITLRLLNLTRGAELLDLTRLAELLNLTREEKFCLCFHRLKSHNRNQAA
jgi:hypothetical protein